MLRFVNNFSIEKILKVNSISFPHIFTLTNHKVAISRCNHTDYHITFRNLKAKVIHSLGRVKKYFSVYFSAVNTVNSFEFGLPLPGHGHGH
jgi:hypothetical protein